MRLAAILYALVTLSSISPRSATAGEVWQSVPADGPPVRVDLGPIHVQLPPGARWMTTDGQQKLLLHLSVFSTGMVRLADRELPASLQAAVDEWTGWGGTLLDVGTTEQGVRWAVVTHEVRAPIDGDPPGLHRHRLEAITMVHGLIEAPGGCAECEVQLKYEAVGVRDAGVTQALAICHTMVVTADR